MTRLAYTLMTLWLAGRAGWAQTTNPVTNGGFERLTPTGFPKDWEAVLSDPGNRVEATPEARSGRTALRLVRRVDKGEVGFNRDWKPFSGEQGTMLAQRKGGLVFYYKAVAAHGARLLFYAIPMSADPIEKTDSPRATFEIPTEHVGDGQWHRAVLPYDFTGDKKVKWVHVSGRIVGGTGELLVDDVKYVPSVGALPKLAHVELQEPKAPGGQATLSLRVDNVGDAAGEMSIGVELPQGLSVAGASTRTLSDLAPRSRRRVAFHLQGDRNVTGTLTVYARAGENEVTTAVKLEPKLRVTALRPAQLLLPRGGETQLKCEVQNAGHANLHNVTVALTLDAALQPAPDEPTTQSVDVIPPNGAAVLTWTLKAAAESVSAPVSAVVSAPGQPTQTVTNELVVTRRLNGKEKFGPPAGKLSLTMTRAGAVLENPRVRAEFPASAAGYGPCRLFVKSDSGWSRVGVIPQFVRAVYHTNERERRVLRFRAKLERKEAADGLRLILSSVVLDADRVTWTVTQTWTLTADADGFQVTTRAHVSRPRRLLAFELLQLYAGAGSFGNQKTEALFPGLEWLVDGERSSNTLDIAADHPDRWRYVPEVYKITVPLMSIHHGSTTVAWLWDADQKWDGRHGQPGAVFCSPDYLEGRPGHLLGFILPTAPTWLDANTREAAHDYDFTPKGALALTARLYLDSHARDSLSALDRWFQLYGVPDPLQPPRGDWGKEIAFSAQAYLDSLWVPDKHGWYNSRGGPRIMERITAQGSYLYDVLMAQRLVADETLQRRLRQRADEAMVLGGGKPSTDDYGITYGNPITAVQTRACGVAGLLGSQRADGSWRFNATTRHTGVFAGKDYTLLGPDGAAEVGTCARNAYVVLRFARVTGDARALAAGKKALAFMNRFTVPRAAQVWEVPVHTPDILAAADACEAYLAGYECTGDAAYLAQARKWARAGLPFLYVWNKPQFPFMRYASIPVFGATWFHGSWFGRPVQWNGLRYAYAIDRLADYDKSFPWRKVARGVTISALYQQSTHKDDVALWPDNISCADGRKSGWIFAPRLLLRNVYRLLGRDEEPWTQPVALGDSWVRFSGRGSLSNVTAAPGALAFTATPPPRESCWLLAAGIDEPETVRCNGALLARLPTNAPVTEPGYRYDAAHGLLLLRLEEGVASKFLLTGVRGRSADFLPHPATAVDFQFDHDSEGWMSAHDLTPATVREGRLVTTIIGPDPYLVRSFMHVTGKETDVIEIRLRVSAGRDGQFYWTTADSPRFAEDKVLHFALTPGTEWKTYRVYVGTHPHWSGKEITAIRLDPGNGAAAGTVELDSLRCVQLGR